MKVKESDIAMWNYILNKFSPYILIGFLLIWDLGFDSPSSYAVIGLILFIDRFAYKTGQACAFYECNSEFRQKVDEGLKK